MSSANAAFSQLEAQVTSLNTQLARMVTLQNGVDPRGYANMVQAGRNVSETFRNAAASSGMFEVQQLRVNSATDDYIKKLNKQKISFREMAKNQKVAQAAYHEQLRMMDASSRVMARAGSATGGRQILDVAIPSEVNQSLDTAAHRLAFLGKELNSASTQMINWGKNTQWAGRQLAMGFTLPLAAAGAAAGTLFYQVDKELTRVTKVYNTTADQTSSALEDVKAVEEELIAVREESIDTAQRAAREYGVAMKDTIAVQADLAAVGMQGQDLQKSTTEVVKNAMLGEIEYQDATKATIALKEILNLTTGELSETWEYMNAIENATSLQMKDFAQAIPVALAPLKDMGATVQDLGVLLTGMVSRGIEVGKAANAIKSLGQRLYRPSKQIQEEFRMLTGEDIMGVIDSNKGNIMGMLEDIYSITKDLDQTSKQKVFSGLFGSYQRTTMGAMISSLGDITNGVGQATTAMEIGQQAAGEWSTVAQRELAEMQESASGKFKRAFESIKAEMTEMGEPFLNIATEVINAISKILSVVNDLPGPVKVAIGALLGITAITGPILMLIGLFANLSGNGIKVVAQIISLATKMEILDKETWAAKLATDALNTSFMSQATATQKLNAELQILIASLNAAQKAQMGAAATPTGLLGPNGQPISSTQNAASGTMAASTTAAANAAAQGAENQKKWNAMTVLNGVSMAAMLGSMVAMSASSNENVQHWANILMMFSIAAPLLGNMASGASKVASYLTAGAASSNGMLKALAASPVMMGLLGAGVGVAVVGAGLLVKHFYDAGKATEKMRKDMAKATLEMGNQSDLLDRQLGIQQKSEKETAAALDRPTYKTQLPELLQIADLAEKMNDDEHFAGQAKLIKNSKDETVKSAAAMHVWQNVMEATNGSAEKAQKAVAALFVASGESAVAAQAQARALREELEGIGSISFNRQLNELDLLLATMKEGRGVGQKDLLMFDPGTSATSAVNAMKDNSLLPWKEDKYSTYAYEDAAKQGTKTAQSFWTGYTTASSTEAASMSRDLQANVSNMWTKAFEAAKKNNANSEAMKALGVTSASEYQKTMEQVMNIARADSHDKDDALTKARRTLQAMGLATDMSDQDVKEAMGFGTGSTFTAFDGLFKGEAGAQGVAAVDVQKAMTEELRKRLGYTDKSLTLQQLLNSANAKSLHVTKETAQAVYEEMIAQQKATQEEIVREKLKNAGIKKGTDRYKEMMEAAGEVSDETLLGIKNEIRRSLGLKETTDLYAGITDESADAAEETKKMANELNGLPSDISVNVNFTGQEVTEMYKDSMQGVQQQIADDWTSAMEERHANEEQGLQDSQDRQSSILEASQEKQQNSLERSQERASDRLEKRQEREERAFEARWERRKDAAEKMWDARIEAVEKEIEAEQKAEDQRQKMFEAEIARIQKLNDMANTNIDFNVALNEGNFDEAAKIRNDAEASAVSGLYEQAMDQMAAQSEARVDRLEGRQEGLEKQKDAYMDRLDKQAEHQKYILQQRHEREANALRRSQELQNAALKRQQAAESAGLKRRQQAEATALKNIQNKEATSLRQRLDLFMSFIARDEKELRKHMKDVGLSYNEFQRDVIVPKSQTWGRYFGDNLKSRMRLAGNQLRTDKVWNALGEDASQAILKSMGFDSMQQFTHFVKTGEMKDFENKKDAKGKTPMRIGGKFVTRHEGGFVDSGKGSRAGITKNGLHKSEQMVLAQKGEYVVNKRAAAANQDLLTSINQGKNVMGGAGLNIPGLVSGVMSAMLVAGLTRGMAKGTQQVANNFLPTGVPGSFGSIAAGNFAGMGFDGEQLKNAQTIANTGKSMGMSSRDIAIGIMTAITESMLRNVQYGDRDSLGLFQQRPSMGWGTPAQVTNPTYASRKFFEGLKGIGDRGRMTPWQAAQAVQRSAFSDGSNYRKYWEEASAIYKALSQAGAGSSGVSGFVPGPGGRFKPINRGISSGLHDTGTGYPAVDVAAPTGTPLYAVSDGVITRSYDITGYEPRRASYGKSQDGYRSYGRVVYLRTDSGAEVLYAHLSKRSVRSGQRVKGGSIIGRSGDTGNSTGSHLHFGSRGASPYTWFNGRSGGGAMGGYSLPQLAKGGEIKWDNTVANLHKNETVLTADLSQKLKDGINEFGSGGGTTYNVNVYHNSERATADEIANKAVMKLKRAEARLGGKQQ